MDDDRKRDGGFTTPQWVVNVTLILLAIVAAAAS
jgi:hypothetical protein